MTFPLLKVLALIGWNLRSVALALGRDGGNPYCISLGRALGANIQYICHFIYILYKYNFLDKIF